MNKIHVAAGAVIICFTIVGAASSNSARDTILQGYAAQAGVSGFSAADGQALFTSTFTTGKPDIHSCTTCHTDNPHGTGTTRVGKPIDPMAISISPERITDPEKVEKWFRRNCNSVIGRECTPLEKGNFITFLISQ